MPIIPPLPDNPSITPVKPATSGIFTNYIFKAIPLAFDESLSYYETLCALLAYLKDTILPVINNNADALAQLQTLYLELKQYVEHYFTNLDVQEEINNKLDQMALDGTLQEIISAYLNSKAIFAFDTVEDMKAASNLINGSYARTAGFYSFNDNAGAFYKIIPLTNQIVVDNSTFIPLDKPDLVAQLIITSNMSPCQFGCYGDGVHDDTDFFKIALNTTSHLLLPENKTFLVSDTINFPNHCSITGFGQSSIIKSSINDGSPIFSNSNQIARFFFRDFYIDADNKDSIGFRIVNPYDACVIENIYFDNFKNKVLYLGSNDAISQTLLINNCMVYMSNVDLNTPIFHLIKCYESNILNNKLLNRTHNAQPCLLLENIYDANVQGNSFTHSDDCGILLTGDCRHNRIISNTYELLHGDYSIRLVGSSYDSLQYTLIIEAFTYYSAPDSIFCQNETNGFFVGMKSTGGRRNMILNVSDTNVADPYGNVTVTQDNSSLSATALGVQNHTGTMEYRVYSDSSSSADYGLKIKKRSTNREFTIDFNSGFFGLSGNRTKIRLTSPDGSVIKYLGINNSGELYLADYAYE